MDVKKSIRALNEFIVNNEDLELLEKEINQFNPLNILKVNSFEIRHSNILSWLLSPNETHGFGEYIIKKVVTETLLTNDDKDIDFPEVQDINLSNLYDVEVRREWENIDILVLSNSNKLAVIIENKIYSKEHSGQLERYLKIVQKNFPGFKILPIFLTKDGDEPEGSDHYCILSHQTIYKIVKFALEMHLDSLNSKVADFVQYYLKSLEGLLMEDEKVRDLCKKIYLRHKEAIDMIVQYGISSSFTSAIEVFLENNTHLYRMFNNSNFFVFVPKEFEGVVPENNLNIRFRYLVVYWFVKRENKLQLSLEVGDFPDPEERVRFMESLGKEQIFKIPKKALEGQSRFTRIFTKNRNIHDWDDMESIVENMQELYNRAFKDANETIIRRVKEFWQKSEDNK